MPAGRDVVDAVQAGTFHVVPVATIEEGIEALSGIAAGTADAAGAFPAESVFGRVAARLELMRQAAEAKPEDENEKKKPAANGSAAEGNGVPEGSRTAPRSATEMDYEAEENACRD